MRAARITALVTAAIAALAIALVPPGRATATAMSPAAGDRSASNTISQPVPPVSARDFRFEPKGAVLRDDNGLIPNPTTPIGSPIAPPSACSVTFAAAHGASSAAVNSWIASHENSIRSETVVCLSGVFRRPLHIWSKTTTALLEVAPAPHATASFDLGSVQAGDTNPNQYWSDAGGISIVDSRSVEIYGLKVENYTFDGTAQTPAGIYVTARSDTENTKQGTFPHLSACFLHGGSCSDIFIIDNTVTGITNRADENHTSPLLCDNADVDAYGIAVIAAGTAHSQRLEHVVVEDNTVTGTRTGESETMTFNGALSDFLVAGNVVDDVDNIGIDTIGWETGDVQASHGYVGGNTVYNVDTLSNAAYGRWDAATKTCEPLPENAAGLYDDGASFIWFASNTVWNTDQGINLDVETPGRETDHLLVSGNVVHDDPGTSRSDPSSGPNPPGASGSSTVAGHDPYAMYIDAFGAKATISDVYVHDNVFQNESQYFLTPSDGMPVVDLGGIWANVEIWHNTIEGLGRGDRYNPLLEIDNLPKAGSKDAIDCNDYENLSIATNTVNGNFASPSASYLSLASWQKGNKRGWDAHSEVGAFSPSCPGRSIA
ncbi:MAG TPA: hypothetical protein VEH29_04050 [Acidimicrobiales bacterium]|nr:hypothetical protein [Acidimicrobiales bacterium]